MQGGVQKPMFSSAKSLKVFKLNWYGLNQNICRHKIKDSHASFMELLCISGKLASFYYTSKIISDSSVDEHCCSYVLYTSNIKSVLQTLVQLIDNFPRHEPQNVNIQQQLAVVRAKFKQVGILYSRFLTAAF